MSVVELESEALKWLGKGESDLGHARHSLKNDDFDWVELASQQAAEKALKAVCIYKGIGLIKTHDLTLLARKIGAPREVLEECGLLNAFYTGSRYPDERELMGDELRETAARDAVKSAERVVKWCKKQIKI